MGTCRFAPNHVFESSDPMFDMRHPQGMNWIWVSTNQDGTTRGVQVPPYPALEVFRTPKWGWRLENPYVILLSDVSSAEYVDRHYWPGRCTEPNTVTDSDTFLDSYSDYESESDADSDYDFSA